MLVEEGKQNAHTDLTQELFVALLSKERFQHYLDSEMTNAEIEAEIAQAQAKREATARGVPKSMLARYDKVRSRRRAETLFPLRGPSCSACDTAIPTQRRAVMAASGTIEMCEGCGALLYAGE